MNLSLIDISLNSYPICPKKSF